MTQQEFQTRYKYNPSTDCIGEGGFGKVYKAYDTHLDRYVAIKRAELKPGLEQVRLKKEVELVSKLPTHPNIANYEACYTFSSFTGEYDFAVLQYYEEGNLQQLIDSGKLTQTQKEALLRQILEGIGFLHNQDIIHRDLKPQNILIAKRNDEYIPKITDFGISKKLDINKSSVFTNSLAGAGTMAYASPEQLLGKTIKKNTDLWSFGVIAFQLLTGNLPFNSGKETITSEAGRLELFKQITSGVISNDLSSIPETWKNLILNCLIVDNILRMQNVSKHRNVIENQLEFETNIHTHKFEQENNTTRVDNRNTTVIANTEPPKSDNNESDKSSSSSPNYKVIVFILAVVILIVLILKYGNQRPDNVNGALQPPNEDTVAVDTVAVVDTVVPVDTDVANTSVVKDKISWVAIPGGMFTMGSPEGEADRYDNETQHEVTLTAFKMSKYEVTFYQYDFFCDATGRSKPDDEGWGRGKRPVINVTWFDAIAFTEWLGCRLPTEAEWEYACRARTTTPFNTGNKLTTSQANCYSNIKSEYKNKTLPVGSFAANDWGLYDMHGNVWEWCSDLYGDYSTSAQTNPKGASSGSDRVYRGGSWNMYDQYCRSAYRSSNYPDGNYSSVGFRVVLDYK